MPDPDPTIERLKERGWQQVAAINLALTEGRIDEDGRRVEVPHPKDNRVVRRLFWIDGL